MSPDNNVKKFVLGYDVVSSAGKDAIIEFGDDETKNLVYFDINSLTEKQRDDPGVIEFMRHAQSGRYDSGVYELGDVMVMLRGKNNNESYEVIPVTDDPFIREDFIQQYGDSVADKIQRPRFLLQDPRILEDGIRKVEIDDLSTNLQDKLKIDFFDTDGTFFINQFYMARCQDGMDVLYRAKVDLEQIGEDRYREASEPYFQRILKDKRNLYSREVQSEYFGITTNHLHQYLALEELLLDPMVKLVILSGSQGTGKSLMPYIAGLMQTFNDTEGAKKFPLYDSMHILKADNMMGDRKVGYLPGELEEKLGPLMDSYKKVHEELNLDFTFDRLTKPLSTNDLRKSGFFLPRNRQHGTIRLVHSGYLRGVTLRNSMILIDEAQNFKRREMKDLLSRAGKGSKIVLMGDPDQVDDYMLSPQKNGLVWAAHGHIKQRHPFIGMMHFVKNERSPISDATRNMKAPTD